MTNSATKKNGMFKCVHCGEMFDLDNDEMQAFSEGYYTYEPDTCDECCRMINGYVPDISELHSDADPGL